MKNKIKLMNKSDKTRICVSILLIVLGTIGYFDGLKYGEELYCLPIFLFALYPLSKLGYGREFKI